MYTSNGVRYTSNGIRYMSNGVRYTSDTIGKIHLFSVQHHCRKCGRALCFKCSEQQSTYPPMGFEIPVRMCEDCKHNITPDE